MTWWACHAGVGSVTESSNLPTIRRDLTMRIEFGTDRTSLRDAGYSLCSHEPKSTSAALGPFDLN